VNSEVESFRRWATRMAGRARFNEENRPLEIVTTESEWNGGILISHAIQPPEDETRSKSFMTARAAHPMPRDPDAAFQVFWPADQEGEGQAAISGT
jgi:hypothetical protein